MQLIITLITVLVAIVVSNFVSRLFPNISNTYINIIIGFLLGLVPWTANIVPQLNSELFMPLLLAPLLFFDGQRTPMVQITLRFKEIVSSAVGLVLISALAVMIIIHRSFNIMLPLSLIVAAISTPTDATGFNSVITGRKIDTYLNQQLRRESLFNDASGIILLQAGTLWFVNGQISFTHNLYKLILVTVGGILFGIISSNLLITVRQLLMRSSVNVFSSQSLLYYLTPILIYLLAETLNVSGIIAVVVAGLIHNSESNRSRFISPRQTVFVFHSVSFLSEILNSIVFLLLGISWAKTITSSSSQFSHLFYWFLLGLITYVVLLVIRFIYSIWKSNFKNSLIFSLGGVHGTVTLVMTFTVTNIMSLHLFMGLLIIESTVILLSLIVPTILFKFLLPPEKEDSLRELKLKQLRREMVKVGVNAINQIKTDSEVKKLVLYDLRDQADLNSTHSFFNQYHQFGTDKSLLSELKSKERHQLMMRAFTAERRYLHELANTNSVELELINEIYSEVLYAEVLMHDPQTRLI